MVLLVVDEVIVLINVLASHRSGACTSRPAYASLYDLRRRLPIFMLRPGSTCADFDCNCIDCDCFHQAPKNILLCLQGSFEKIGNICEPASLPGNYMEEAQALALEGCYVLGISMKRLNVTRSEEALVLSRDQLEAGLSFSGLMAFRNELKHDTRDAILEMKEGNVRPVMITGGEQCPINCQFSRYTFINHYTLKFGYLLIGTANFEVGWNDQDRHGIADSISDYQYSCRVFTETFILRPFHPPSISHRILPISAITCKLLCC